VRYLDRETSPLYNCGTPGSPKHPPPVSRKAALPGEPDVARQVSPPVQRDGHERPPVIDFLGPSLREEAVEGERVQRRLAAILAADVAGYSRLTGADEEGTIARLRALRRELIDPAIATHRGRIVKTTGDGILIEFASVVDAVRCAVEVQRGMATGNDGEPTDRRIEFRIGVHIGDVIVDGDDLVGDGVNVAARLEGLAEPGGVCISEDAYRQVQDRVPSKFVDSGEQHLRNIARPVRVYRLPSDNVPSIPTRRAPLRLPDKPSIAVLPFDNMSGDPDQEYFADGVVEEIITSLSRTHWLFVIARNSSFTYRGRAVDVRQVGRELGVRYVLEGSVRKTGNRVRITGQLVDASTGAHLWADRFDGRLDDIFDLQDQISASVIAAISPKLQKAEIERAKRKPTESLDAYDCYLRGIACPLHASREANDEALGFFNRAISLDPDFAAAYGHAANCYTWRKINGWLSDPANELAEAERLARRGAALGEGDPGVLAAVAWVLPNICRDLDAGAAMIERALAIEPNRAGSLGTGGFIKIWLGEPDAGIERLALAMRLSPFDPSTGGWRYGMALANFLLGRYDEASSWAASGLQLAPDAQHLLRIDAASNALAGRLKRAREAVARLRELNPTLRVSNLREVYGPFRRAEDLTKLEDGLRQAGLPE
jgi:TolB-like protein/class 3 adenylate cyclase